MFKRKTIRYIPIEEMNERLRYCATHRNIVMGAKPSNEPFGLNAYIEDKQVKFSLSYKYGGVSCTYVCRKDGAEQLEDVDGFTAFNTLSKYYKVPDMTKDKSVCNELQWSEQANKFLYSAKPLLYKNPKYEGTRNDAIGYDLNSSYPYAMLKDMPDTSVPYHAGFVKEGEIGFERGEDGSLTPKFKGFSFFIFPLMKSPFKRFVEHWYSEKKSGNVRAKGMLNFSVGYLQRVNPFLRATIIYYANLEISKLIDENTLYCNTDSIVSLTPRDLTIGKELGNFKIEHQGKFAYKNFNYQWDYDPPSYRGVSKKWFKPGWDILKDPIPQNGNIVKYENYQLVEVSYGIKSKKK